MGYKYDEDGAINRPIEERIKKCRAIDGKTIQDLAEMLDTSRPVLSKILSGKQDGPLSLIKKLEVYATGIEAENPGIYEETNLDFLERGFVQTRDANNVIGVCSAAQETVGLGVVVGKSGYGKSHALKYYATMPRVAYIECDSAMYGKDFISCIEETLGLPTVSHVGIWPRLRSIEKYFKINRGHLLIVDEADKLISASMDKKLEILRALYDKSSVGIVIAGEPKLKTLLENYSERFTNRVDFYACLQGLSEKEVREVLKGYKIEEAAVTEIVARATNKKNGCYRLLDRTLDNVERLLKYKGEDVITLEIIQEASSLMMI